MIGQKSCIIVKVYSSVFQTLSATPPLSNCHLCQAPLTINKLFKQMHLLVNFFVKLSILQSA